MVQNIGGMDVIICGGTDLTDDSVFVFKDRRYKDGIRTKKYTDLSDKQRKALMTFGGIRKSILVSSFIGVKA